MDPVTPTLSMLKRPACALVTTPFTVISPNYFYIDRFVTRAVYTNLSPITELSIGPR